MLNLGLAYAPKIQNRYPHMLQEDIIIWKRFVVVGDYLPDVVWYDVRCGSFVKLIMSLPIGWLRWRFD